MSTTPTKLLYINNMQQFTAHAQVLDIVPGPGERLALTLDQTIFHPQGGGQPYDTGTISTENAQLNVNEVRMIDGVVHHMGTMNNGTIQSGDMVDLQINKEQRLFHSRNHTAGHIIDIAMSNLGIDLLPGRGNHFPVGAFVEYIGTLEEDARAELLPKLQREVARLIKKNNAVSTRMVTLEEVKKLAKFVPDYLPKDKPSRIMLVDGYYAIPCGGTHAQNLGEVRRITITKIKNKKGNLRIGYTIAE